MRKLFILFAMLLGVVAVSAQDSSETELWYTSADGNVVIPQYADHFGDATIVSNVYQDGKGIITFDRKLTCIGDYAFMDCDNLTSIEIPNGVEYIGSLAFYGVALTSITLPVSKP